MKQLELYYKNFRFNFSNKNIIEQNRNKYLSIDNENIFFIRDFCSSNFHEDIDSYFYENELKDLNENIVKNQKKLISSFQTNRFLKKHKMLIVASSNVKDQSILEDDSFFKVGFDSSLLKFHDKLDLYFSNNPTKESMRFFPEDWKSLPEGLFSLRTYHGFIDIYRGSKHGFSSPKMQQGCFDSFSGTMKLEDHRCAILSLFDLAYMLKFNVIRIIGLKNYLSEERPGSSYIKLNTFMYPQQIINHSIIFAGAFWLNRFGIKVEIDDENMDICENIKIVSGEN